MCQKQNYYNGKDSMRNIAIKIVWIAYATRNNNGSDRIHNIVIINITNSKDLNPSRNIIPKQLQYKQHNAISQQNNNGLNSIRTITTIYGLVGIHDITINGLDWTCNTTIMMVQIAYTNLEI